MSDIRMMKFGIMIEEINESIVNKSRYDYVYNRHCHMTIEGIDMGLALIFDYDKLNDYGKVIMEKPRIIFTASNGDYVAPWHLDTYRKYNVKQAQGEKLLGFEDMKTRMNVAKEFVQTCRIDENIAEGYKFIFWSLMILTVDKTNMEEHLSLICDFVKMLRITDEELEDIVSIIKCVYGKEKEGFYFKTDVVPKILCLPNWCL